MFGEVLQETDGELWLWILTDEGVRGWTRSDRERLLSPYGLTYDQIHAAGVCARLGSAP